jgi:2-polyprenyl-3-methyl-5-hydroxy-6-metoxy-1,4-benzoquinol methylase
MNADADDPTNSDAASTADPEYAERLKALQTVWWKRVLPVQAPYRWNLRRLKLGRTLDVGCGIGRNLASLPSGVGVDHNATAIQIARENGHTAFTVAEFESSQYAVPASFDSLLFAHVLEHMPREDAKALIAHYLPFLRRRGRICLITPQERGYASDATHVEFVDFAALREICDDLDLIVGRTYSFPFPRRFGRAFIYNEFVLVASTR